MNTKQIDTLLKLKSSGKVLKSNLDHFRTVKDIINEKLVPDLAVCFLSLSLITSMENTSKKVPNCN